MNVLSLFDGISCGQVALQRAGAHVDNYFASEIKPNAIKVTQHHFPNTIQLGDIKNIVGKDLPKIDLIIGGSPCQGFSIVGLKEGFKDHRSSLFFEYVRLLEECNPDYFLLENVNMNYGHSKAISDILGVTPVQINSNLVSYQNRSRLYWSNIPIIKPVDKCVSFQKYKDSDLSYLKKFKVNRTPSREIMWGEGLIGKCRNVTHYDKINCLTLKQDRWSNSGLVAFEDFCRYLTTYELEQAQTLPKGYCDLLTRTQAENVLGDGWTVDVIAHIFRNFQQIDLFN